MDRERPDKRAPLKPDFTERKTGGKRTAPRKTVAGKTEPSKTEPRKTVRATPPPARPAPAPERPAPLWAVEPAPSLQEAESPAPAPAAKARPKAERPEAKSRPKAERPEAKSRPKAERPEAKAGPERPRAPRPRGDTHPAEGTARRARLADRLMVASGVLSIGFLIGALVLPVYNGEAVSNTLGTTLTTETIVAGEGAWVLIPLAMPLIVTALVAVALRQRRAGGWAWSGTAAWTAVGLLAVLALLSIPSIGLFIIPVVLLLAGAVRLTPDATGAGPDPDPGPQEEQRQQPAGAVAAS